MLLAGLVYRSFGWEGLFAVFAESMRQSAVVMILIAGAFIINYAVTAEQLASMLSTWIQAQQLSPTQFLLLLFVLSSLALVPLKDIMVKAGVRSYLLPPLVRS